MKKIFYQKKGIAIKKIASELYLLDKNDQVPTMNYFQDKYNISRGTVQNALMFLKESNAIKTKNRGHLGTYIQEINYKILQYYAGLDQLIGTMPLPYSKLYEGLATGLFLMFKDQDIKLNLAFIRGSKERIDAVDNGRYNFGVVSRFAAEEEIKKGKGISIAVSFGISTYLSKHVIIFSSHDNNKIKKGMKIGIDKDSLDHYLITKELVKDKNVSLVDYPANQLIHAIRKKEVDAGVWNYDEIVEKNLFDLHFADIPVEKNYHNTSEAVLVCSDKDQLFQSLCKKNISVNKMHIIQELVKTGRMTPRF